MKKVVLITGASSGIGKSIAERLLKDDFILYVAARRTEKMRDLETQGAYVLELDITSENNIVEVVGRIEQEHGGVDILINNAGYAVYGAVEDIPMSEARRQFEVNLFGLASLTKKVLPYMRAKREGLIINMSSIAGKIYTPLGAWYHATKFALEGWSDCLRVELKPFDVNVVIIEPGAILTEFADVMYEPMLEYSGEGPYQEMAHQMARSVKDTYKKGMSSPPSVIAEVVAKAIYTKKPKYRYAAGKFASTFLWIRKWLGDRLYDKALQKQLS